MPHNEWLKKEQYKSRTASLNFAVSRAVLYKVISDIEGIDMKEVVISKDENNKPYYKNNSQIRFNISHTEGCVLVGFSSIEIGVDVELVKERFPFQGILEHCFTNREIKYIGDDQKRFIKFWVGKESYLKYQGVGFLRNPKEIEIECRDENSLVVFDRINWKSMVIFTRNIEKDFLGAVCVGGAR